METKNNYHALQQKIESTIEESFDSFLAEETKIKIIWYRTQDDKSIYVDYHNKQGKEIGHNDFSTDETTLGGVINALKTVIVKNGNWEIKKRNWFAKTFSIYNFILVPKTETLSKKKRESVWDKLCESLFKKRWNL